MTIRIEAGLRPGCIGRITALHAHYYAAQAGFGVAFEARVARELAAFCVDFDPRRDGLWLVLREFDDGTRIEGSVALDGAKAAQDGAHLRWFIVGDALRGQGMGRRLLAEAIGFAEARGYARIHLNTFAGLDAARHLYESAGFRLVHEAVGRQWSTAVTEQRFERGSAGS